MFQALSKLDNALNGKVNNLYRDSSGSSYSPPPKKHNFTPPKPPRKAPSASPPSARKGYASLDELEFGSSRRSNIYEEEEEEEEVVVREEDRGHHQSRYNNNNNMEYTNNAYTSTNPGLNHLRGYSPASRQSPSRGNHTDSELLSSPSQVLYATISADKSKAHSSALKNQHMAHSASQTVQTGFRPVSVDRQIKTRTLSKENILDDPPSYQSRFSHAGGMSSHNHNQRQPSPSHHHQQHHGSRSLERFVDSDKENRRQELKARIHVTSPHRFTPDRQLQTGSRKPYKTTINTANDTIQYKGFSQENLARKQEEQQRRHHQQQFHHSGKRLDNEHYKVPKNKAPVPQEFLSRRNRRNEAEGSANYMHNGGGGRQSQFASTSLVRNAENRQKTVGGGGGEYDREGRRIRSEHTAPRSGDRNRAYSGYSTSPDREVSPDRYKHRSASSKAGIMTARSPSSSPTRPPRTRAASSGGEINIPVRREHSARRVERTPSTRAAATSRSPIKKIQRVHNEIQSDQPGGGGGGTLQRDPRRPGREPGSSRNSSKEHPGHSRTLTLSRDRGDKSGGGGGGLRAAKTLLIGRKDPKPKVEDRLSKFTEYRGSREAEQEESRSRTGGGGGSRSEQEQEPVRYRTKDSERMYSDGGGSGKPVSGRRSSHSVGERMSDIASDRENYERERGQSVPPGANIDSMRDFYKTAQYRSMYHLPPSPSRPAPVLDRSTKPTTLERGMRRERSDLNAPPPRRISKTSMSEGELTDDVSKAERVLRQRNNFINNLAAKNGENARRANSNDREEPRRIFRPNNDGSGRRTAGNSREREKRPAPQPPTQRIRRSSVDILETSVSESESPRQEKVISKSII